MSPDAATSRFVMLPMQVPKKAKDEWGFKLTEVTPSQSTDSELTLRRLAKLKYDLIIGVGFLFQEPMKRVASEFPDVKFALIDAVIENNRMSPP